MNVTILVGIPGSGKSFYAKRLSDKRLFDGGNHIIILSSDDLREIICKDVNDQSKNYIVFQTMEHMAEYLLKGGFDLVIDATNIKRRNRKIWVELAKKYGAACEAHAIKTPLQECLKRNAVRERNVPVEVVERMAREMEPPKEDEGWDKIVEVE